MKKYLLSAAALLSLLLGAAELKINNRPVSSGYSENGNSWQYEKTVKFVQNQVPQEFLIPANKLKRHKKHAHIQGYNGDIILQFKTSGEIKSFDISSEMTNFADKNTRKLSLSYSTDGVNFKDLDVKELKQKAILSSGKVDIPSGKSYLFIKLLRHVDKKDSNGRFGFVLWQKMKIKVTGTDAKSSTTAVKNAALKEVFPTGVFWAWERTQPNADYAKMELWDFVEHSMKTLKENGYNTCWFVNISNPDHQVKILALAEKHGLRVLTNSDLLNVFYGSQTSFEQLDSFADKTVARIGHSKALLGYVLKDEPLMCDIDTCGYFYELMKKADPTRDSLAVVMNRQSLSYLRDSKLPVVCTDIYYFADNNSTMLPAPRNVGQQEFTNVVNLLNLSAERHGKHSWLMGQMFGDIWGYHWYKNGKFIVYPGCYLHWRMPTIAESQWQIWEALRLGSKGFLYYVFHSYIPLTAPPEKASTPAELKLRNKMEKQQKMAASWGNQKLVKKQIELDWSTGMLHPGGKPTKQMLATGNVMKLIRANEKLLLNRRRAEFPVFFASDKETDTETFRSCGRYLGIVVNRNLDKKRTFDVLLPVNVKSVKNLADGRMLKISEAGKNFRKITLSLDAGTGALLEPEFFSHPGIRYAKESFDHQSIFRTMVNLNAEIFHHGNYGADENRSLRLKKGGDPNEAVCAFLGISKPDTAVITFSKNIHRGSKGVLYCLLRGKLGNARIAAVTQGVEGEKANFQHLRIPKAGKLQPMNGRTVKQKDFHVPAVMPDNTTAIEFFIGKGDYIEDITLWFVPFEKK